MFHTVSRKSLPSAGDDSSVVLLELRRSDIVQQNATHRRMNAVSKLYTGFKINLLQILVGFIRDNYSTINPGDVVMTIDNGKEGSPSPHLDLNKGDTKTWSMEQTLRQYIEGVRGYSRGLINMPDFVVNETLRYLHTNENTKKSAPVVINDTTPFKPVLPNCIRYGEEAFILLNKIFPKDIKYISDINRELRKYRPDLKLTIKNIIGDGSEIDVNGNKLNLCHSFTNLTIELVDDDSSSTPTYTIQKRVPPHQDDEKD